MAIKRFKVDEISINGGPVCRLATWVSRWPRIGLSLLGVLENALNMRIVFR